MTLDSLLNSNLFKSPEVLTSRTGSVVNATKLQKKAQRTKQGKFLIEGENALTEAIAAQTQTTDSESNITDVFITEKAAVDFAELLYDAHDLGAYIHLIDNSAVQSLSDTATSTGLFAVCTPVVMRQGLENSDGQALFSPEHVMQRAVNNLPIIAVPIDLSEPGNAGTIIRMTDAVGGAGVIFAGQSVDPESSKAVRASAGSLFHLSVDTEKDPQEAVESLRGLGYQIFATTLNGQANLDDLALEAAARAIEKDTAFINSASHHAVDDDAASQADAPVLARPTVWLFGNEAHGLGDNTQLADATVTIPQWGRAESMNVAVAATICLHESAKAMRLTRASH